MYTNRRDLIDPSILFGSNESEHQATPIIPVIQSVIPVDPLNMWKEFLCFDTIECFAFSPEISSCGYKIYAFEDVYMKPYETKNIGTKIRIHMPYGNYGILCANNQSKFTVISTIIEADDIKEVFVKIQNIDEHILSIKRGDCIAILTLHKINIVPVKKTGNLNQLFRISN